MNKLEELIKKYDNAYYNEDDSEISDAEYDALKARLLASTRQDEIDYVPGEATKGESKYEHGISILSLEKVQITDNEGLRAHLIRLWPVAIQKKYDGLTDVFYGEQGVHATRGNGFVGENITKAVATGVAGIGATEYTVRGEILIPIHTFHELNRSRVAEGLEPHKNPRNTAAGMLRNLDTSKVEGLRFFAYDIIVEEGAIPYKTQLSILREQGFNVADTFIPDSVEEAIAYIENFDRSILDYEIDGLVVKHIGDNIYGVTGHHPKNAIAIKFEQTGVWTKLSRIRHQVGRTGKVTPVADFEPIDLLGAEVAKASLHNQGILEGFKLDTMYVMEDGMGEDIYVKVIKANEIIPQIIDVRFENKDKAHMVRLKEISNCPECNSELIKENDQHFCINSSCPAKVVGALVHMAKRDALDITGLSEETAIKLVNQAKKRGEVNLHPSFVFKLELEDFESLPGFAKKSAKNLYNAIQGGLKEVPFDRFIYATGMPLVGRSVSRLIVEHYKSVVNFLNDNIDFKQLEKVNGIGTEIINSLVENYSIMLEPFGEITDFEIIEPQIVEVQGGKDLKIVITGKFEISRDEIKALIESMGSKTVGSVSKATNILLASPGEESTSKYKKAKELGIQIINSIKDLKERL